MNNKMSVVFLCIFLAAVIIISYIFISSITGKLNEFTQQFNDTNACISQELSGLESDVISVEPAENTPD